MSKLACFDNIKNPALKAKFSVIKDTMSETEQKAMANTIIKDFYKSLQEKSNTLLNNVKSVAKINKIVEIKDDVPKPIKEIELPTLGEQIKEMEKDIKEIDVDNISDEDMLKLFGDMGDKVTDNDDIMNDILSEDKPLSNAEQNTKPKKDC